MLSNLLSERACHWGATRSIPVSYDIAPIHIVLLTSLCAVYYVSSGSKTQEDTFYILYCL